MPKLEKYVEILCNIPYAIQGVILAVGIISLYSGKPGFLSNRLFLLVGAYCIIILPYTFRGLKNTIGALNVKCVIEAAQVLGMFTTHAFSYNYYSTNEKWNYFNNDVSFYNVICRFSLLLI